MPKIVEKEKFYTCRNDRAFKEIFLKEQNRDLLKKLLEKALGIEIFTIEEQNIERNTGNLQVRRKYLDILLSTNTGLIGIELNAQMNDYLRIRNMAFQCDNYSHYTLVGEKYTEEIKVIQLNFTYGLESYHETKDLNLDVIEIYEIMNKRKLRYVKNFFIYEFNMDKIMEFWYSKDKEKIEEYKYFIMMDLKPKDLNILSKESKLVKKYMSNLEELNEDPQFRSFMTVEEDQRKIRNTELSSARREGIREASIEIAKKMLQMVGITQEQILAATGLSIEELESLK